MSVGLAHTSTTTTIAAAQRLAARAVAQATAPMPATDSRNGATSHSCRWAGNPRVRFSYHSGSYHGKFPSTTSAPGARCPNNSPITGADTRSALVYSDCTIARKSTASSTRYTAANATGSHGHRRRPRQLSVARVTVGRRSALLATGGPYEALSLDDRPTAPDPPLDVELVAAQDGVAQPGG